MLGKQKVMAFLATTNAARSLAFYKNIVGLRLIADEEFAVVFDANGTMLRIQKAESVEPAPYTALGWEVSDIDSAISALRKKKVSFERYGFLGQDGDVWTAPGGTRIAWFKDPDGNLLSLTQFQSEG